MGNTDAIAALLKAELYGQIKAFIDRREKRCSPDDARHAVTLDSLMNLAIKFGNLPLEHLEMICAVCRNSVSSVVKWMRSRRPGLDNRRPCDLIETGEGVTKIKREIEKLFRAI